jgi:hypothetical protein
LALIPGSCLGVYEVIAPIGEGGMGQVVVIQNWTEELKRLVPTR